MNSEINRMKDHLDNISAGAHGLVAEAADAGEKTVLQARNSIAAAISAGKDACLQVRDRAVAGAKATDRVIRANPYAGIGIALGVGAIFGYLLWKRKQWSRPFCAQSAFPSLKSL